MPSSLIVPVAEVSSLAPHPNADTLDVAQVLGWQCVVKRGEFQEGQKVLYFAPDLVVDKALSDEWGITQYLDKGRIKATRLRGEPSFGFVLPCADFFEVGANAAEWFPGVSKYEPPTRPQRGGNHIANPNAVPRNPLFPEYTHIENLRHFPNVLSPGELVVITEKLHGTNSRIGMIDGEWVAGSHRMQRGMGDELYWSPRKHAEQLVESLAAHHKQVILYGEILGAEVQSLDYGYIGHEGYRAFDLMVDGRYLDFYSFMVLCTQYDVPMVPVLDMEPFSLQSVREKAKGNTKLGGVHLREGVVVRPLVERTDPRCGRCVLKYVSDDFLLAKKSDFAEV